MLILDVFETSASIQSKLITFHNCKDKSSSIGLVSISNSKMLLKWSETHSAASLSLTSKQSWQNSREEMRRLRLSRRRKMMLLKLRPAEWSAESA